MEVTRVVDRSSRMIRPGLIFGAWVALLLLFPSFVLAQHAYGGCAYGDNEYQENCPTPSPSPAASSGSSGSGGSSGGDEQVTDPSNTIKLNQSTTASRTTLPIVSAITNTRLVLTSNPVDADRLKSLRLRVLGKNYFFTDSDGDGRYTLSIVFSKAGRYPYALTADWGITTRTEHGVFDVKNKGGATQFPISQVNQLFYSIFGRTPTAEEWAYWARRREDKPDKVAFLGAMQYHRAQGRTIGDSITSSNPRLGVSELNKVFRSVYTRNPTQSEWRYWANRLKDKFLRLPFIDALRWHFLGNIRH